jgi:hypothetical protein
VSRIGSEQLRPTGKLIALALVAYLAGYLATALLFLATNGNGIEATPNEAIPYYAGFAALYGAALGWWWLVSFPFLDFDVVEPIWNKIRYDAPVHYAYDRPGYVLAGTLGIAAGVTLHLLYRRTRFKRASRARQSAR